MSSLILSLLFLLSPAHQSPCLTAKRLYVSDPQLDTEYLDTETRYNPAGFPKEILRYSPTQEIMERVNLEYNEQGEVIRKVIDSHMGKESIDFTLQYNPEGLLLYKLYTHKDKLHAEAHEYLDDGSHSIVYWEDKVVVATKHISRLGQLVEHCEPSKDRCTRYSYNPQGDLIGQVRVTAGKESEIPLPEFEYDAAHLAVKKTTGSTVEHYSYGDHGLLTVVRVTDAAGNWRKTERYEYDFCEE